MQQRGQVLSCLGMPNIVIAPGSARPTHAMDLARHHRQSLAHPDHRPALAHAPILTITTVACIPKSANSGHVRLHQTTAPKPAAGQRHARSCPPSPAAKHRSKHACPTKARTRGTVTFRASPRTCRLATPVRRSPALAMHRRPGP